MKQEMSTPSPLENLEASQDQKEKSPQVEIMARREAGQRKQRINWLNASGLKFNRLTVLKYHHKGKKSQAMIQCLCDCGNIVIVGSSALVSNNTHSCGCRQKEVWKRDNSRFVKHGHARKYIISPTYESFMAMKTRCHSKMGSYKKKNITVCDRWRLGENGKSAFECFLEDMGEKPTEEHSIDRIDVSGNYHPGNCRWATNTQQANNKRNTVYLEFNGVVRPLCDWARMLNIKSEIIRKRISCYGWSIERALTTPKLK